MNQLKYFCYILFVVFTCISCSNNTKENTSVEIRGIIQKQLVTTYMYGTHTISSYAIRSSSVDLDNYINQTVTVNGYKIEGYPVDGGPDFVEVTSIKEE